MLISLTPYSPRLSCSDWKTPSLCEHSTQVQNSAAIIQNTVAQRDDYYDELNFETGMIYSTLNFQNLNWKVYDTSRPELSGCQTCGRHCSTSRSVRTDGTVIHCITARIAITLIIILLIKIWMACTVLYSTSGSSFLLWSGCKLQNRYSKCCYAWVGNFWKCWRIQVLHVPLLTFSSRFRFVKEDTM